MIITIMTKHALSSEIKIDALIVKTNEKIKAYTSMLHEFSQKPDGFRMSDFPDEYALYMSDINNLIKTHKSLVVIEPQTYDFASVLTHTHDEIADECFLYN